MDRSSIRKEWLKRYSTKEEQLKAIEEYEKEIDWRENYYEARENAITNWWWVQPDEDRKLIELSQRKEWDGKD